MPEHCRLEPDECDLPSPRSGQARALARFRSPRDERSKRLDVRDGERRVDADAVRKELLDVLPALCVSRARKIGMCQLVDKAMC